MTLPPGPWRRGTNIALYDGSYVTRSRCKTGYQIWRCEKDGFWRVWRNNLPIMFQDSPLCGPFNTWQDAFDALEAETYGRHDRLNLGWGSCVFMEMMDAAACPQAPKHRPGEDKWDAYWLLWQERYVLSQTYTLTQRGWHEAYGISGPVAEALDPVTYQDTFNSPTVGDLWKIDGLV